LISFFNGLKTYEKKNQLKNSSVVVIFLSILNMTDFFEKTTLNEYPLSIHAQIISCFTCFH